MTATNEKTPFRGAVLTIFGNDAFSQLPEKLSYFAYGKEVCPSTGRDHLQAFAYAKKAMRLTGWKKLFPTAHIEVMRGTFMQNEKYCSKEGQFTEFGERPMEHGKKRSDLLVKELIDADPSISVFQIYEDTQNIACVHHKKFFEEYREHKRQKSIKDDRTAPEVYFIYGKPGSGKTRFVYDKEPDVFKCPSLQWFNGYTGQDAVLIDNLEIPIINKAFFLQLIDRYPMQVPTKGGFTWWKPKRIYITSVYTPVHIQQEFTDPNEFKRRITVYKKFD